MAFQLSGPPVVPQELPDVPSLWLLFQTVGLAISLTSLNSLSAVKCLQKALTPKFRAVNCLL